MNKNIKTNVTKPINFRMNVDSINHLQDLALYVSQELDVEISYVDIIRNLIVDNFPIEDDLKINEQQKKVIELCHRIDKQASQAGVKKLITTFTNISHNGQMVIKNHDIDAAS